MILQSKVFVYRRLFSYGLALLLFSAFPPASARACADYQLGIHKERSNSIDFYVSVAKSTALSELDGSMEIASAESRLLAKRQLQEMLEKSDVSKKTLNGVLPISACIAGLDVYSKISISEVSIRQANRLQNSLQKSFLENPSD